MIQILVHFTDLPTKGKGVRSKTLLPFGGGSTRKYDFEALFEPPEKPDVSGVITKYLLEEETTLYDNHRNHHDHHYLNHWNHLISYSISRIAFVELSLKTIEVSH